MSADAREAGETVLALLRQSDVAGIDVVPALAIALGRMIAEQCYPDPPFLTIVGSGAIIGAAARDRHDEISRRGALRCGMA